MVSSEETPNQGAIKMSSVNTIKTTILLSILSLVVTSLAQANETIRFDSPESTARATKLLHEIGLRPFMDKVWNQQVAAPGIHSKYWVDQIARDNPGQASLERAYRDFGYEVSVQVEDMAFEIYENPDKNHERERLDWLLRFSKWLMKPGKFENFRIGMRIEDAATMPLHRVIFDFSISNDDIDGYFARFTTFKESALIRAGILYEESNGVLDVRDLAQKAEENKDDGFEYRWISLARKAYRYFGSRMPEYTLDPEIIEKVGIQYSFFADDIESLWGRNCIPNWWDRKCHDVVCVFRATARGLDALRSVLQFRKDIGEFPEVDVPPGTDVRAAYEKYYFDKYNWEQKLTRASARTAASFYVDYKENSYLDSSTFDSKHTKKFNNVTQEQFESWQSTKDRRIENRKWLEKHGFQPKHPDD